MPVCQNQVLSQQSLPYWKFWWQKFGPPICQVDSCSVSGEWVSAIAWKTSTSRYQPWPVALVGTSWPVQWLQSGQSSLIRLCVPSPLVRCCLLGTCWCCTVVTPGLPVVTLALTVTCYTHQHRWQQQHSQHCHSGTALSLWVCCVSLWLCVLQHEQVTGLTQPTAGR